MSENQNSQPDNQENGGDSNPRKRRAEKLPDNAHGKIGEAKEKLTAKQQKIRDKTNPPGGYDSTPVPSAVDGYTIRFTFHRAENLPISDLNSRSSDPYIHAALTSELPKRHKEDPDLILRT